MRTVCHQSDCNKSTLTSITAGLAFCSGVLCGILSNTADKPNGGRGSDWSRAASACVACERDVAKMGTKGAARNTGGSGAARNVGGGGAAGRTTVELSAKS